MSHLTPHSSEWFKLMEAKNAQQAAHTKQIVGLAGSLEVCSVCGDDDPKDYRVVGEKFTSEIDVTARLCDDCQKIQSSSHGSKFTQLYLGT